MHGPKKNKNVKKTAPSPFLPSKTIAHQDNIRTLRINMTGEMYDTSRSVRANRIEIHIAHRHPMLPVITSQFSK